MSSLLSTALIESVISDYFESELKIDAETVANDDNLLKQFTQGLHVRSIEETEDSLVDDDLFFELAEKMSSFPRLTFDLYLALRSQVPTSIRKHFKSSNFLIFCKDTTGEINTDEFLRYYCIDITNIS